MVNEKRTRGQPAKPGGYRKVTISPALDTLEQLQRIHPKITTAVEIAAQHYMENKMYTVTTYTLNNEIIPDMTTVVQGMQPVHLSQINPDLRGTSPMPDAVQNEYFPDYETAAEHAQQFGYVPNWVNPEETA